MPQIIYDIMSDPIKYAEWLGLLLVALLGVIKTVHALLLALELVAKLTPTKADDDALSAADGWVLKVESGLIWLQQKLLMLRGPKAATRLLAAPVIVDDVGSLPPEDPADRATQPERPSAKR